MRLIKDIEDIILSNDKKKVFRKDLLFDEFDDTVKAGLFAIVNIKKIDSSLVIERIKVGGYLLNHLKFNFISTIRIISLVVLAASK